MHRGLKWLIFASTVITVIIVGLLILAFVPGLGGRWTRSPEYWLWDGTRLANPWVFLGSIMIALLMLAIPLSHIAWLVLAAIWLAHSTGPSASLRAGPSRGGEVLNCPHCGAEAQPEWQVCPYCGERLEAASNEK